MKKYSSRVSVFLQQLFVFLLPIMATAGLAQPLDNADEKVLSRAKLVNQNDKLEIYRDGAEVDQGFITNIEQLFAAIEAQLGRKFDEASLGKKIRIVVSDRVRVSHVWRGYQHMHDPKPIIFLNIRAYQGFQSKSNATLIHEMTHLFTWKYNSHSLREGLADYVARSIMSNTAVGPNEVNAIPKKVDWALKYLASDHPAPMQLLTNAEFRKDYYLLSYVVVKALIERTSMSEFLKFYDSPYSDALFQASFGIKRTDLICYLGLDTSCQ
jgi:hypothetical protein